MAESDVALILSIRYNNNAERTVVANWWKARFLTDEFSFKLKTIANLCIAPHGNPAPTYVFLRPIRS